MQKQITYENITDYERYLYLSEKAEATIKKYSAAVSQLKEYLDKNEKELNRENVLAYRSYIKTFYKTQTVNGIISAINMYFTYIGKPELKVKLLKIQKQIFIDESRELTRDEYNRLLDAALKQGNKKLYMIMITMANTGIRISELQYITVEAIQQGRAEVDLKAKKRIIIIVQKLREKLLQFAKEQGIESGILFRTNTGNPLNRSNILRNLKSLSEDAQVDREKIYPHNFRHLFARSFYEVEKNIVYLADVLGHSQIETTRLYVATSTNTHERILNQMKLM